MSTKSNQSKNNLSSSDGNSDINRDINTLFGNQNSKSTFYDHQFIKSNFCRLRLSRSDIQNLSSDFPDQTLGGHRVYREELIDGKLAKVYEYKIKIVKYDREYLKVERKVSEEPIQPTIIVENNLIIPFTSGLAVNLPIQVSPEPLRQINGTSAPQKRGRPRKYPVGKEPYKRKNVRDTSYEVIPEEKVPMHLRSHDNSPLFELPKGYFDPNQSDGYYEFQNGLSDEKENDLDGILFQKRKDGESDQSKDYWADSYKDKYL